MPLSHSPIGEHGRIHYILPFPWGHLMVPEDEIISRVNCQREQPVLSITELGLNKLSISDFKHIFKESGLRVISFETNLPGLSWEGIRR